MRRRRDVEICSTFGRILHGEEVRWAFTLKLINTGTLMCTSFVYLHVIRHIGVDRI